MTRVIYVNGSYQPYQHAVVHVEDRGYQFADAVYEVCEVQGGRLVDERRHMGRMARSLRELKLAPPMSMRALGVILRETVRRNRVEHGLVYVQISRGVARRDFLFPNPGTAPTVVCLARNFPRAFREARAAKGIAVKTMPDIRWKRPDIKTVALLPNSLARQAAKEAGASEAWFVDEHGYITEGAASNAWIIGADGALITRPADSGILRGITRGVLIELAAREGIAVIERPFTLAEAKTAREAFITSATNTVLPVVNIDGAPVGNGAPGEFVILLRRLFYSQAEISAKHALLT